MNGNLTEAYSNLGSLLARRNITVFELHKRLYAASLPVNIKSLYRLTSEKPLQKVDLRIVGAICKECGVDLGELIAFEKPRKTLQRLSAKTQFRLDELMTKNNGGRLSASEKREFAELADEAHRLSISNARKLLSERRRAVPARRRVVKERKPAAAFAG